MRRTNQPFDERTTKRQFNGWTAFCKRRLETFSEISKVQTDTNMSINIVTTSFFENHLHSGKVYSVAIKQPKSFVFDEAPLFYPTWSLVLSWKSKIKEFNDHRLNQKQLEAGWQEYTNTYTELLESRKDAIAIWVKEEDRTRSTITFTCHEKQTDSVPNCHRNILGSWLEQQFNCKHYCEKIPVNHIVHCFKSKQWTI